MVPAHAPSHAMPRLLPLAVVLLSVFGCVPAGSQDAKDMNCPTGPLVAKVRPFVDRHCLAGAVMAVADRNKTVDVEAVGSADTATGRPMAVDSVFWIASQTKPMTTAALMMLVDEGKVSLDDPVEKFLPEFKGQKVAGQAAPAPPAHPVTVREILSHTSGLPFSIPAEQPTLDGLSLAEAARAYASTFLDFQPGTNFQYSNAGINTAGRIIEVVSGLAYERFLDERLLQPLGMKETTFWPDSRQVARLAKSYKPASSGQGLEECRIAQLRYPLDDRRSRHPMPAGGLFSTASDVARFCRMILADGEFEGKRLLSVGAIREMTRRQTPASVEESYGLGLALGDGWCGHGGAHATHMQIDRKHGLVLVWMVQHAGFAGDGGMAQGVFQRSAVKAFAPNAKP